MPRTNEKISKNFCADILRVYTALAASLLMMMLFFIPTSALCETSSNADKILTKIENQYAGKSFKAAFIQKSVLSALDMTETASGNAYFSHPGKMRWQYLTPEHHEVITNGKQLWIYRPAQNQVMTGNAQAFFKAGSGGAFLSDITLVRKNFDIKITGETPETIELELAAKTHLPDIAEIKIKVSKKETLIQQVTTKNQYNDTMVFEFNSIEFVRMEPGTFEFSPPEGISIIKMDE